jgi:O-antigen/teichoic acid export membrane protein
MYISLSLVLIIFLNLQWEARILAYFSSILFVVFIIIKYNLKKIKKIKKFNLIIFSKYFSNYFLLSFKSVIFSLNDWIKVNIDKFLIFILLGAESTGLYFFITQFCLAIYFIFFAINKVILPYQIKQYKVNYEKYKRQDIKIILSLIIVSFIGFFIAKYLIEQFVIFFIDYKFLDSLKYLNLMLVIYIMHIYMLYLSNKFIILKKQSYLSVFSSMYVLLFLSLSFLLYEKYHLFGVIYANLITTIIVLLSYIIFYVKIDKKEILYND